MDSSEEIAAGQGSSFPTFFVWRSPDLSEFVVGRLEDWANGSRKALGLGCQAFADLIGDLPGWEGDTVPLSFESPRRESTSRPVRHPATRTHIPIATSATPPARRAN